MSQKQQDRYFLQLVTDIVCGVIPWFQQLASHSITCIWNPPETLCGEQREWPIDLRRTSKLPTAATVTSFYSSSFNGPFSRTIESILSVPFCCPERESKGETTLPSSFSIVVQNSAYPQALWHKFLLWSQKLKKKKFWKKLNWSLK